MCGLYCQLLIQGVMLILYFDLVQKVYVLRLASPLGVYALKGMSNHYLP